MAEPTAALPFPVDWQALAVTVHAADGVDLAAIKALALAEGACPPEFTVLAIDRAEVLATASGPVAAEIQALKEAAAAAVLGSWTDPPGMKAKEIEKQKAEATERAKAELVLPAAVVARLMSGKMDADRDAVLKAELARRCVPRDAAIDKAAAAAAAAATAAATVDAATATLAAATPETVALEKANLAAAKAAADKAAAEAAAAVDERAVEEAAVGLPFTGARVYWFTGLGDTASGIVDLAAAGAPLRAVLHLRYPPLPPAPPGEENAVEEMAADGTAPVAVTSPAVDPLPTIVDQLQSAAAAAVTWSSPALAVAAVVVDLDASLLIPPPTEGDAPPPPMDPTVAAHAALPVLMQSLADVLTAARAYDAWRAAAVVIAVPRSSDGPAQGADAPKLTTEPAVDVTPPVVTPSPPAATPPGSASGPAPALGIAPAAAPPPAETPDAVAPPLPPLPDRPSPGAYYAHLLAGVPPEMCTVQVMLDAALEQVARDVGVTNPDAALAEDLAAAADAEAYLEAALGKITGAGVGAGGPGPAAWETVVGMGTSTSSSVLPPTAEMPYELDATALAAARIVASNPASAPAVAAAASVEARMRALLPLPGIGRLGMPPVPTLDARERGLARTALAAVCGDLPVSAVEHARVLRAAVALLPPAVAVAHGESLKSRRYVEALPPPALAQALSEALHELPAAAVGYSPFDDAAIVVLYAGLLGWSRTESLPRAIAWAEYWAASRAVAAAVEDAPVGVGDVTVDPLAVPPLAVYDLQADEAQVAGSRQYAYPSDGALVRSSGPLNVSVTSGGALLRLRQAPPPAETPAGMPPAPPSPYVPPPLATDQQELMGNGVETVTAGDTVQPPGGGDSLPVDSALPAAAGDDAPKAITPIEAEASLEPPPAAACMSATWPDGSVTLVRLVDGAMRLQVTTASGLTVEVDSRGHVIQGRPLAVGSAALMPPLPPLPAGEALGVTAAALAAGEAGDAEISRCILPSGDVIRHLASGVSHILLRDGNTGVYDPAAPAPGWVGTNSAGLRWRQGPQQRRPPPPRPTVPPHTEAELAALAEAETALATLTAATAAAQAKAAKGGAAAQTAAAAAATAESEARAKMAAEARDREDAFYASWLASLPVIMETPPPEHVAPLGTAAVVDPESGAAVAVRQDLVMTVQYPVTSGGQRLVQHADGTRLLLAPGDGVAWRAEKDGLAAVQATSDEVTILLDDGLITWCPDDGSIQHWLPTGGVLSCTDGLVAYAPPTLASPSTALASELEGCYRFDLRAASVEFADERGEGFTVGPDGGVTNYGRPEITTSLPTADAGAAESTPAADDGSPIAEAITVPAPQPAPKTVPRVFVVQPSGEGYEVLDSDSFEAYLALADANPECSVDAAPVIGAPTPGHTQYAVVHSEYRLALGVEPLPQAASLPSKRLRAVAVPALRLPSLPPAPPPAAGVVVPRIVTLAPPPPPALPAAVQRFRQVLELPRRTASERGALESALDAYDEWEHGLATTGTASYTVIDSRSTAEVESAAALAVAIQAARAAAATKLAALAAPLPPRGVPMAPVAPAIDLSVTAKARKGYERAGEEERRGLEPPLKYFGAEEGLRQSIPGWGGRTLPPPLDFSRTGGGPTGADRPQPPLGASLPGNTIGGRPKMSIVLSTTAGGASSRSTTRLAAVTPGAPSPVASGGPRSPNRPAYVNVLNQPRAVPVGLSPSLAPTLVSDRTAKFIAVEATARRPLRTAGANAVKARGLHNRQFALTPAAVRFGAVLAGGAPAVRYATLTNIGLDTGRFSVRKASAPLKIKHKYGPIAAGMSVQLLIELAPPAGFPPGPYIGHVDVESEYNFFRLTVVADIVASAADAPAEGLGRGVDVEGSVEPTSAAPDVLA